MRSRLAFACLGLALFLAWNPRAAAREDLRVIARVGPDGPYVEREVSPAAIGDAARPSDGSRDYTLLWSRSLPDPIYTTTGISGPTGLVFAGNWLNPPKQAEAIPLDGNGTPSWVDPGTEFYVDAARAADVFAGLDCTSADSTAIVAEWRSGSPTPLWTYPIHPCRPLDGNGWSSGKGVQVSDDGSTIAVIVNSYDPGGLNGTLVLFNAGDPVPAVIYPLPDGTASALAITPDGAYVAVYAWPNIYVYDRYAETLRWSGSAFSGNDALAISAGGNYLAWGWNNLYLRRWNGSTYAALWTTSHSGYYVTECALSADETNFAVAWYKSTVNENVVEMYSLPAHALLWSYTYPPSLARGEGDERGAPDKLPDPTEVISEMVFSNDDRVLAACSWGQLFPELHVFERLDPTPVAVLDTPGSMFDVDAVSWGGRTFVAACGKHVHAGIAGRGADLYALELPAGEGVDPAEPGISAPAALAIAGAPNPFRGGTTLRLRLAGPGSVRLSVHDLSGRAVARLLDGEMRSGSSELAWMGVDDLGRALPAGTYVLRLATPRGVAATKLVRMR
jgi:hypothetical protein